MESDQIKVVFYLALFMKKNLKNLFLFCLEK